MHTTTKRFFVACVVALAAMSSRVAAQQTQPENIHGKVTDDSSRVIAGATVMVTRGPDRLTQQGVTDSSGRYRVHFEEGTGDYLVYVSATGYRSARRRVQRQSTERELTADFTLGREVATLDAIKVEASKPVRATNGISPMQPETGSSESWKDGVNGGVPPTSAGDLNAIAGTMSNVTLTPGGISIAGSGSESNLTTLNGMGFSGGSIPRAARTETRVTGATFDATRGGFAGANIDVRLGSGDRDYQNRNGYVSISPRALQAASALADALGATSNGIRASFGADGELIRKAMTYNVAVDVSRNISNPLTLLSADADALLRAGIAPDSVARLIAIATPLGLPLEGRGVPDNRRHDAITWLGRLDDTRDTLQTRALTTYLGWTHDGGLGFNPLAAPSASGQQRERTIGAQLTLGAYVGAGKRVLTETRLAASEVRSRLTPYGSLPSASILVRSPTADLDTDVTGLTLGGGSSFFSNRTSWTAEGSNLTMWNAGGSRHRFKAFLWGRTDGLRDEGISNGLGTFTFNSIADFQAGNASSFSRTLVQPARDGRVWNAAAAFVHQYVPSRYFSVVAGARLEGDGFLGAAAKNPALEQALGVTTGAAPARLHVSPRVGFSYTYNRDKSNGNGMSVSNIGRFYRTQTGSIRGGIGEFRDLLRPGILADAAAATGLPGATANLFCVGSATPAADWTRFAADPATIPSQCLNGGGPLAEAAPSVTLVDPSYDVPRSWRASVDWSSSVNTLLFRAGALASYDLSQPGTIDANFAGVPRFSLAGESGRPVFVSASAIDPASGSVSAAEARKSSAYGRVGERVSDLRGYGGQLMFGISPDLFRFRGKYQIYASAGYTLQWSRREFRGFDGAALGDPRVKEWAAGPNDARHVLVLTGGFATSKTGTITFSGRAQSGLPFTPIVQGDINGDGRGGDRAFVPNPATENDASLASAITNLLASGSGVAHDCLVANLGRVAGRNTCRGPWTQTLNIQWSPPLPQKMRSRVTANVYFENVLSHAQTVLDPVLLVPRGFDAAAQRFRYDVNPRFADTRTATTMSRAPFRAILDFTMNLSVDYGLQQLRRAVEPIKVGGGWERRSADSLAAFYLTRTSDIFKMLIDQSDSLFLSRAQIAALQAADSIYSARVRAVYVPLGKFLAQTNGDATKAQLDSANEAKKQYWTIFWEQPEIAAAIVTPSQRELVPMFKSMLAVPLENRKHSQWSFGYPVTLTDKPVKH